ncbi:MAG: cytochrome c [Acidimicrobiales bacterium]
MPAVLLVVVALIAASCGADAPSAVIASGKPVSATDPGLAVFRDVGCANCHGQSGQGKIGPAMGGHAAEQVVRQVRAPLGAMPLFTTDELSDSELEAVVGWVTGLEVMSMEHGGGGEAEAAGLDPRDVLRGHHWMTLSAIEAGNAAQAIDHITNITALVTGEHLAAMNEVVAELEAGDLEAAAAGTLEMLAGFVPGAGSIDKLHVQLGLQALVIDDPTSAAFHLEQVGEGEFSDVARAALEALDARDTDLAVDILQAALVDDEAEAEHDG